VLVVREAYEIPDLWQQGAHEFRAWAVDERLIRPRVLDRSAPFALAHPEHIRHALTISLPEPPGLAPLSESVKNPAFQLDATWSVRGTDAHLEYVYRSLREAVSPGDVPEFVDRVDRAADLVVCRVGRRHPAAATSPKGLPAPGPPPVAVSSPRPQQGGLAPIALVSAGALATAFLAWGARAGLAGWRRRRRRSRFASRARAWAGEDPGHAIRVRTAEGIERSGLSGTCPCGGPWREVDRTTVQYDGQPMTVATRRCLLCSGERALYFIEE
jgi:hypothetical protein